MNRRNFLKSTVALTVGRFKWPVLSEQPKTKKIKPVYVWPEQPTPQFHQWNNQWHRYDHQWFNPYIGWCLFDNEICYVTQNGGHTWQECGINDTPFGNQWNGCPLEISRRAKVNNS